MCLGAAIGCGCLTSLAYSKDGPDLPRPYAKDTVVLAAQSSGSSGETLYNGIVLPKVWPPRDRDPASRAVMPVPYLAHGPEVVPIDIGRQLFVDDFLIESTDLARTYHQANKFVGNPVLKPEAAKERDGGRQPGVVLHSGGVWYDHRDRSYKIWYTPGWHGGTASASKESFPS